MKNYIVFSGLFVSTLMYSAAKDCAIEARAAALFKAIHTMNYSAVENILSSSDSISLVEFHDYSSGNTPLIEAVSKGDVKAAQFLLNAQADVNRINPITGERALYYAAVVAGHGGLVRLLLDSNAYVNSSHNPAKGEPIMQAFHRNNQDAVLALLPHKPIILDNVYNHFDFSHTKVATRPFVDYALQTGTVSQLKEVAMSAIKRLNGPVTVDEKVNSVCSTIDRLVAEQTAQKNQVQKSFLVEVGGAAEVKQNEDSGIFNERNLTSMLFNVYYEPTYDE